MEIPFKRPCDGVHGIGAGTYAGHCIGGWFGPFTDIVMDSDSIIGIASMHCLDLVPAELGPLL